jgi:hypothetical protein
VVSTNGIDYKNFARHLAVIHRRYRLHTQRRKWQIVLGLIGIQVPITVEA